LLGAAVDAARGAVDDPSNTCACCTASPCTVVQRERSPDSNPSSNNLPDFGVFAVAVDESPETLPAASRARTWYA